MRRRLASRRTVVAACDFSTFSNPTRGPASASTGSPSKRHRASPEQGPPAIARAPGWWWLFHPVGHEPLASGGVDEGESKKQFVRGRESPTRGGGLAACG